MFLLIASSVNEARWSVASVDGAQPPPGCSRERAPIARLTFATPEHRGQERRRRSAARPPSTAGRAGAALDRSATELKRRDSVDSRSRLPPLDTPGWFGRRNCNVNLDDLRWDRPELDCEPQQARGIRRNLQLDETVLSR